MLQHKTADSRMRKHRGDITAPPLVIVKNLHALPNLLKIRVNCPRNWGRLTYIGGKKV